MACKQLVAQTIFVVSLATQVAASPWMIYPQFWAGHEGLKLFTDIYITPDESSFVPGTILDVELDIQVHGQLFDAKLDDSSWGAQPGNNPFTGTVAEGIVVNTMNDTLFVSARSQPLSSTDMVRLITIETSIVGLEGLAYGGRSVLPDTPEEYLSSRIVQNGVLYDGIEANWYIADGVLDHADYNGNGVVDAADYTVWRDSLGQTASSPGEILPADRSGPFGASDGIVDESNYTLWKTTFGYVVEDGQASGTSLESSVPEPASTWLISALFVLMSLGRGPHRQP